MRTLPTPGPPEVAVTPHSETPPHETWSIDAELIETADWPVDHVAAGVTTSEGAETVHGDALATFELASVTKVLTAIAAWIAAEEETISFQDPLGPPGATVADLLGHASGVGPDDDATLAPPRTRRIYSNRGIELVADHIANRAGMAFSEYLEIGVLEPLGLRHTRLTGSPAHGAQSCVADLLAVGRELLAPRLIHGSTLATATSTHLPDLDGVLPGFGSQRPNPWGLGVEVKGRKAPHWTHAEASPLTFGHFGRSGTLLWVDPVSRLAGTILTDTEFGPWAAAAWPPANARLAAAGAELQGHQPSLGLFHRRRGSEAH